MDITGTIIAALPYRVGTSKSGREWYCQDFVVETHEQYPKRVFFTVIGKEKLQKLNIVAGKDYTVSFDINAHEYNGKWYNSVTAWDARPAVAGQPAAQPAVQAQQAYAMPPAATAAAEQPDSDALLF